MNSMKTIYFLFFTLTLYSIGYSQVPAMNPIMGASVVCSSPGTATNFSATASNSPTSYLWSVVPSASVVIGSQTSSQTSIDFPYTNGTYTVYCSATNGFGTSPTTSFVVTVFETPTVTFSGSNIFCQGSSTNLQASSTILAASTTISYNWAPSAGLNTTTGPFVSASPTIPTTYTVTGTIGNCSSSSTIMVSSVPNPVISTNVQNNPSCFGSAVIITASGANTYTIGGGVSNGVPFVPSFLGQIAYSINGQDLNGCTGFAVATLTVNQTPALMVSSSQPTLCIPFSATLSLYGAPIYSVNGSPSSAFVPVSPTVNTTYTITGQNGFGCQSSTVFTQYVTVCIGVNEMENNPAIIKLHPNPSDGRFYVTTYTRTSAVIINELGQTVRFMELVPDEKTEVSGLDPGIYFIIAGKARTKIIITR
jgi:hypothetical protein